MQVSRDHYDFERYCGLDRFSSYYYQISELLALKPQSVLEVGTGDGFLKRFLMGIDGVSYKNIDIAPDLHPDIVGSVLSMPLPDKSFDVTVAFEVLEHLPFEEFEKALTELKRVSKRHVLLSLPHFGPPLKILLKIPFFPEIKLAIKVPYRPRHRFNGEHYWEIGKKGYSPHRIRGILERYFTVEKDFVPFEHQYHHFYVLRI